MTTYPQLKHAPIAEALLDFRVEYDPATSLEAIKAFGAYISERFPTARPIHRQQIQFTSGTEQASSTQLEIGRIFWNTDNTRAVQATLQGIDSSAGGFTVNWTSGYQSFNELVEIARSLWSSYCSQLRPVRVVRSGLRYVNKISLANGTHLGSVLRTLPHVDNGISDVIDDFFVRFGVPFDSGRRGIITESLSPATDDDDGVLIFDIDVFVQKPFSPTDDSLWAELDALRSLKNRCFFNSFTESCLERFK